MQNIKKLPLAFLISFIILLLPLNASAEVLFGGEYQKALHKHLTQAEKSITIAMYFIILEPRGEGPINQLVNDLVDAKNRGVSVKVILEDSKLKASRLAYQKLKEMDKESDWFLHSSSKLLLNGSRVKDMRPTKLSLEEVIEVLKNG